MDHTDDPPHPRQYYIFPVDDTPILYICFLKTTQRDRNMVIYIPLVKEPDSLPPNVKTEKYDSYKGISGYDSDTLTVIVKSINDLTEQTVTNYDELIRAATYPIDSMVDREMVRSKFAEHNIQQHKVPHFEDPLDIPNINDAVSSSQPVRFTPIQTNFLKNAHLEITDFTMPFYALSDSIFTSLEKLEMFIKSVPELIERYNKIRASHLFIRFTQLSSAVAGSNTLTHYITQATDLKTALELQVTHSVFKGVVETVSKIHDKPEVQFLLFLLECLNKMKETLNYRGFDSSSNPYKMLLILENTFREVLNIYINGQKSDTSGVSQEKCRDVIIRAGKQFEEFLRTVFQCPINPWVSFDNIPRASTSTLKKKGVLEMAISGINTQQGSSRDEAIRAKLKAATHAVLDAVGPTDLQQLNSGVTVVFCNAFRIDGAPSSFDDKFPWAALFMYYESVSCNQELCKTPETIQTLRRNKFDVFSVTSKLVCASSSPVKLYHKKRFDVPHHKGDIGRYVSIIHPCYNISNEFIDLFVQENATNKTSLSAPFGCMYLLFDFAFPSFSKDPPFFVNGLRKFYTDVQSLFKNGQTDRTKQSVFTKYNNFLLKLPFPLFVVIDGLLYVLVLVIDTIYGGISNNMTMYLLCKKKFKETNVFRGPCGSSGKCETLFRQSGCIVLEDEYFEDTKYSYKQPDKQPDKQKFKKDFEEGWSDTTCEIAFNAKELLGDQFKAMVADITVNIVGQQCSFLSVDNCLIEGCSGTSIPLGLIRLSEFWKPRGTTMLPTLTKETVADIARLQLLFWLYGSFDTTDSREEKIKNLTLSMGIFDVTNIDVIASFLNVSATKCYNKLKTNIKKSYKEPILAALKERLDLFEKAIVANGFDIPDNMTDLEILRVYLVYLKHYYKVKADGDTDTSLLLNLSDFVSLMVDPITGPSLSKPSKIKGYVCNDGNGFKELVINPSATDKLESSEALMAHAVGSNEAPAAYNAIVDIIKNDTSLSEPFEKMSQGEEQLMPIVEITIKMLLSTFDIFQLLELLQYLEQGDRVNKPIAIKASTGLLGSTKRGLSVPYKTLISVLYGCIRFAFDIYIEDIIHPPAPPAPPAPAPQVNVVLQHIESIRAFLNKRVNCDVKHNPEIFNLFAETPSTAPSAAPLKKRPHPQVQQQNANAVVSAQSVMNPSDGGNDLPPIISMDDVRPASDGGWLNRLRKRFNYKSGSRKYTKRTKKFKRTPNKRNKTIRNKINTNYSLRNTIKRRKTHRRK